MPSKAHKILELGEFKQLMSLVLENLAELPPQLLSNITNRITELGAGELDNILNEKELDYLFFIHSDPQYQAIQAKTHTAFLGLSQKMEQAITAEVEAFEKNQYPN